MKSVPFNGVNTTLKGNGDTVADMVIYTDGLACVSAWEISDEELAYLIKHRRIYLTVFHVPDNFPPVGLTVESPLPPIVSGTKLNLIKP